MLFVIGGGALLFAVYSFLKGRGPAAKPVVATAGPGGFTNLLGKSPYGPGAYPRISNSLHARAYATTTTTDTVATLKNKVLQNILNGAESVSVVLGALETVKAEIETYTAKLQLVIDEKTAGRISQSQVDAYINEIVKAVAEKLQITLKQVQFPGWPSGSTTGSGVPDYYKDYYQQYMDYIKQLYENYYKYYQPSYQYYPGSQYNYYQPYQYQYPYPYYPAQQYGGMSSYGFSQGYNPYAYGMGGYGGQYGGNMMYGQQGTQGYGYGQAQYNFY